MKTVLITICARGGSKGIPGKNVKLLNEKPLISYSIEIAKKFIEAHSSVSVALSTDSDKIKEIAKKYGLDSNYTRPLDLATDTAPKIPVIKDVLLYEEERINKKFDYVIDLDVTSPLRTLEDLNNAFEILEQNPLAVNLFSVSKPHRNPYFNVVEKQSNGFYNLVKSGNFVTRQSSPEVFDLNASFYIYKRHFFDTYKHVFTPYSLIYEVPHICFDLDEPIEFEFLEFLLKNNKLNFQI